MKNIFESRLRLIMLVADFALIVLSFFLAYYLRMGSLGRTDFSFYDFMVVGLLSALLWVVILLVVRAYCFGRRVKSGFHISRVIFANVVGVASFVLLFYFLKHEFYSRMIILYLFGIATGLILGAHVVFDYVKEKYVSERRDVSPVLIIGANRSAGEIIEHLQKTRSVYQPVAVLDGYGTKKKEIAGVPVMGKLDKLEKVVEEQEIEMIIQADNLEHTLNLLAFAEEKDIRYILLPTLMGIYGNAEASYLEGLGVIEGNKKRDLAEVIFGK